MIEVFESENTELPITSLVTPKLPPESTCRTIENVVELSAITFPIPLEKLTYPSAPVPNEATPNSTVPSRDKGALEESMVIPDGSENKYDPLPAEPAPVCL
jgi:hypothetical protein